MLCILGWAPWADACWGIYETCDCGLVLSEVLKTLVGSHVAGTYYDRLSALYPDPCLYLAVGILAHHDVAASTT